MRLSELKNAGRTPELPMSLTLADAYATAGFAMGTDGLTWVDRHDGYRGYGMVADNANAVTGIEMEPARQSL